jgi:hypothetical protein
MLRFFAGGSVAGTGRGESSGSGDATTNRRLARSRRGLFWQRPRRFAATNDYRARGYARGIIAPVEQPALYAMAMNAKLKLCLAQTGRRQYQIAREVGLTENELSRFVRGRRSATADERRRLALVLGVSEPELF